MSCYCRTIPKCRRDISKLRSAQRYFQKVCQSNDWDMKNYISNLELNHGLCITPDNIEVLSESIIRHNDPVCDLAARLLDQCQRQINSLENELSRMEDEDDRYHEDDDD